MRLSLVLNHLRPSLSQTRRTMASVTIPPTMRAFTIPQHGDVSVIEETTLSTPKPSPSEFLIKVEYVRITHTPADVLEYLTLSRQG